MAHYFPTDLVDPQKFKEEFESTVHIIDPFYWKAVKIGHYVRIRSSNEYFWVQVREVSANEITGEVYYKLGTNPYQIGDLLTFKKCFQFDIYDPQVLNLIPGINV